MATMVLVPGAKMSTQSLSWILESLGPLALSRYPMPAYTGVHNSSLPISDEAAHNVHVFGCSREWRYVYIQVMYRLRAPMTRIMLCLSFQLLDQILGP